MRSFRPVILQTSGFDVRYNGWKKKIKKIPLQINKSFPRPHNASKVMLIGLSNIWHPFSDIAGQKHLAITPALCSEGPPSGRVWTLSRQLLPSLFVFMNWRHSWMPSWRDCSKVRSPYQPHLYIFLPLKLWRQAKKTVLGERLGIQPGGGCDIRLSDSPSSLEFITQMCLDNIAYNLVHLKLTDSFTPSLVVLIINCSTFIEPHSWKY